MQTVINAKMALGVPGTHGNTQPYLADVYIAGAPVTMGTAVELDASGNVVPCTTVANAIGIAVNPNEHVNMALPSDTATLTVPAGATVAVAKKGAWYVAVPTNDVPYDAEEDDPVPHTEAYNWVKGAKLNYSTSYNGLVYNASGTVAEILEVEKVVEVADATAGKVKVVGHPVALIRFL